MSKKKTLIKLKNDYQLEILFVNNIEEANTYASAYHTK